MNKLLSGITVGALAAFSAGAMAQSVGVGAPQTDCTRQGLGSYCAFKIDAAPVNGQYLLECEIDAAGTVDADYNTYLDVTFATSKQFNWASNPASLNGVILKAGRLSTDFPGGLFNLAGPMVKDISHATFCWDTFEYDECWKDETAWADGSRYSPTKGQWATYTAYSGEENTVTLFAGKTYEAGTVTFSDPVGGKVTITVTLNEGFQFAGDTDESLKIQGYAAAPSGNPAVGQFADKKDCEDSPCSIDVDDALFYGVHVDVERAVDCEE
jgi:hypothetical protein